MFLRYGRKDAELRIQVFVDRHDRGNVSTAVAVIRSRPDSHDRLLGKMKLNSILAMREGRNEASSCPSTDLVAFID